MKPTTIVTVGEEQICQLILAAKERLVFVAPGASQRVATAICQAWQRLGAGAVKVVLDVDPEVCRLGYGTMEGLKSLDEAARRSGTRIHCQPGIRIGLLIADHATLIYAPTPLLIEAGSTSAQHPNAVLLQSVPAPVAKEVGIGERGADDQTLGVDEVPANKVEAVTTNLERNPPVQFDVARKVRVFNAQFEFVEFELHGCAISRKTVPIPSDLVGLAKDEKTQRLLKSSFRLIDQNSALSGDRVSKLKQFIVQKYLIQLHGYGTVVLRTNKDDFLEAVKALKKYIDRFQKKAKRELEKEITANRETLAKALLPAVVANVPKRWEKYIGRGRDEGRIRELLEGELCRSFGSADDLFEEMEVTVLFKGVTYESLIEQKFVEVASKAIPFFGNLHEEYDAAPETKDRSRK
jgi:hypothetical protein